jgi:hypothetical protein
MGRRRDSTVASAAAAAATAAALVVVVFHLYAKLFSPVTYCGVSLPAQDLYTRYRRCKLKVANVGYAHDGSQA